MKAILRSLLFGILICQGCSNEHPEPNQFSSSCDTLLIRTAKQKGSGLFELGVVPAVFSDSLESFPYPVTFPEHIRNPKRMQLITDFRAQPRYYIDVIQGRIGEAQVIIVDENNNKDLRDDSIRIPQPINWQSDEHLILCKYSVSKGVEPIEDSSWLRLGILRKKLWCLRSEHLLAELWIDRDSYLLGLADPRAGDFTYGAHPQVALISHNSSVKDTLLESDLLEQGEILKLNNSYYSFDKLSYFGDYLYYSIRRYTDQHGNARKNPGDCQFMWLRRRQTVNSGVLRYLKEIW